RKRCGRWIRAGSDGWRSRRRLREYAPAPGVLVPRKATPSKGDPSAQANAAHRPPPRRGRGHRYGGRYSGGQREESFEEGRLCGAGRGLLTPEWRHCRSAEQGLLRRSRPPVPEGEIDEEALAL